MGQQIKFTTTEITKIKTQVESLKTMMNDYLSGANDSLEEVIKILGGSSQVAESIHRFSTAAIEEKNSLIEYLDKVLSYLEIKIDSYSSIDQTSSDNLQQISDMLSDIGNM